VIFFDRILLQCDVARHSNTMYHSSKKRKRPEFASCILDPSIIQPCLWKEFYQIRKTISELERIIDGVFFVMKDDFRIILLFNRERKFFKATPMFQEFLVLLSWGLKIYFSFYDLKHSKRRMLLSFVHPYHFSFPFFWRFYFPSFFLVRLLNS